MVKKLVKGIFRKFGFEIRRKLTERQLKEIENKKLVSDNKWLTDYNFRTIIDIGANEGQFAHKMRMLFPEAVIISFEPIPQEYEKLKNSFKNDNKFIAFNVGLGDKECTADLWLNEYTPSSSLLKMKKHLNHFLHARNQSPINIVLKRLDQLLDSKEIQKPYFVKIDVQGYEEFVINGGKEIIEDAELVIVEVSYDELYEGNVMFDGIYTLMKSMGFNFSGNFEQLRSQLNNKIIQGDAIFIK